MEDPQTRTVEVVSRRTLHRRESVRVETDSDGRTVVVIEREAISKKLPDSR